MLFEGGSHPVMALFAVVLRSLSTEFAATVFENTTLC